MDLMCAPSQTTRRWREQFGRMLIEAMACGVPVVASPSGEIPHVVGDAGLLVDETDVAAVGAGHRSTAGRSGVAARPVDPRPRPRAREVTPGPSSRAHIWSFSRSCCDGAGKAARRVIADYLEEGWPSMDLVADMLFDRLQREHAATIAPSLIRPTLQRRAARLPGVGQATWVRGVDRVANRLWDYPRLASPGLPTASICFTSSTTATRSSSTGFRLAGRSSRVTTWTRFAACSTRRSSRARRSFAR